MLPCLTHAVSVRNQIRLGLGRTGTAVVSSGGGQGLPLPLPDSWEPGECREGFLFDSPPGVIVTVSVSWEFLINGCFIV